jgi:hypothetical protein
VRPTACLCGRSRCSHKRQPCSRRDSAADQHRRKVLLASTPEVCWRCGEGPRPGDPWHAGHVIPWVEGGTEVRREHRSCNLRAGGELGAERKREKWSR